MKQGRGRDAVVAGGWEAGGVGGGLEGGRRGGWGGVGGGHPWVLMGGGRRWGRVGVLYFEVVFVAGGAELDNL